MNVQETSEIRKLTSAELDEVTGGEFLMGLAVGAALALLVGAVGADLGSGSPDYIEEGQKYLQGKGGKL